MSVCLVPDFMISCCSAGQASGKCATNCPCSCRGGVATSTLMINPTQSYKSPHGKGPNLTEVAYPVVALDCELERPPPGGLWIGCCFGLVVGLCFVIPASLVTVKPTDGP